MSLKAFANQVCFIRMRFFTETCTLSPIAFFDALREYKMQSSSSEDEFVALSLLGKKKTNIKQVVHPPLNTRQALVGPYEII